MVAKGDMLEHAEVFGNYYGSPKEPVEDAINAGRDVLFDIDWQGGQQVRASALGKHVLSIFILPPSIPELERRLYARAQDSKEVIDGRMSKSRDEISHWPEYDYVLVNEDLDETEARLKTIVAAERLRLSQQPDLVNVVRRLNKEFEERS
jgi:guanylate kinase